MPERTPDSKTLQNLSPSQCENQIRRLKQSAPKKLEVIFFSATTGSFWALRDLTEQQFSIQAKLNEEEKEQP